MQSRVFSLNNTHLGRGGGLAILEIQRGKSQRAHCKSSTICVKRGKSGSLAAVTVSGKYGTGDT